ncbi:nuclear transport factor 2 family protein [Sphingobacterium olei]|uniref:Nuclear transport factor 2 family protein n=1 Tax=Sphingobacterium olei TaxID=2571155 RepID=A0A4U0N6L2_9SPHI|nr:nuclear transport factor 2 family protein [Sphingobacterium olei]TJZ49429.1 nuclear transport factor 2 family protein [Sphingobacterium olei]
MTKIKVLANCGNSPKNTFVKDFNVAYTKGDIDALGSMVSDEVTWELLGNKVISGKAEFIKALEEMKKKEVLECTVETAISHGKSASASGRMTMSDGDTYAFADIYEFSSTKGNQIKHIKSYIVKV